MLTTVVKLKRDLALSREVMNSYRVIAQLDAAWIRDNHINNTLREKGLHIRTPYPRYVKKHLRHGNMPTHKPYLVDVTNKDTPPNDRPGRKSFEEVDWEMEFDPSDAGEAGHEELMWRPIP